MMNQNDNTPQNDTVDDTNTRQDASVAVNVPSTTQVSSPKTERQKNPKRVEAGKKGAAARKAKRLANEAAALKTRLEDKAETIDKVTRDTETLNIPQSHITVYKNYIPLCFVGLVGLGAYIYFNWRTDKLSSKQPVNSTVAQPAQQKPDPFDF